MITEMKRKTEDVRLQKFLADRGIASRRRCAELIAAGRVEVDGVTVTAPGRRIVPARCRVLFEGRPVSPGRPALRTLLLHKPRGYICSASSKQGQTVFDLLPALPERLVPVGRLDKNSEGLLLLSNDGELVHRVTHPRYGHEKTYHVSVSGDCDSRILQRLRSRMTIAGHRIEPAEVRLLSRNTQTGRSRLEFILREGRNRQVREMCSRVSLRVHRLVRVAVGGLGLGRLKPGEWRELSAAEVARLRG